ncbi:MAG: hypothetical protein GTO02_13105 [Candidatus Dadabacteria bacterium]|nr:hypothetical protein [Candidatus Dadabacteria bacterium]
MIEFYTTEELVNELANRTTFVGIIIRSEKEAKHSGPAIIHQNWDITYSRLTNSQCAELLGDAVEHFHDLAAKEDAE